MAVTAYLDVVTKTVNVFNTTSNLFLFEATVSRFQPPMGHTVIRLRFKENDFLLETPFDEALIELLVRNVANQNAITTAVDKSPISALGLFIVGVVFCASLYWFGMPLVARLLPPIIPTALKRHIGLDALNQMDEYMFEDSQIDSARRELIIAAVESLGAFNEQQVHVRIRRWYHHGIDIPNAMAMLPEYMIITDGLIYNLSNEEILAVAAHELGHLYYDHGTQGMIQESLSTVAYTIIFGANKGGIAGLTKSLLDLQYSRDQERQADEYAVMLLKKMGKDPLIYAKALAGITGGRTESEANTYLSDHPMTAERIENIQRLAEAP